MSADRSISRRAFLAGAGAAAGAAVAGGVLAGHYLTETSPPGPGRISAGSAPLVLVTLYGGNDGLNTVVPYADPAYAAARPSLGYRGGDVLDLGDGLGLNPKLAGLHSRWQSGELAVIRGVGYPNPNLSHFASMAIWQTANVEDGTGAGWLGRWLDRYGDDPMLALSLGATLPPVLRGVKRSATAIVSPDIVLPGGTAFQSAYATMQAPGPDRPGLAGLVASSGADLLAARSALERLTPAGGGRAAPGSSKPGAAERSPAGGPAASRPTATSSSALAAQMAAVAGLIKAGAPTRVYSVSLSSFDTHAGEKANHERLLAELDGAVTTLFTGLGGHPVVVMTYSEFGRRPAENASGGTDHGTAAPIFVLGSGVNGGRFYGDQPSLTSLDANGNQQHTIDFRSVYSTVLERVLGSDAEAVLGASFPSLPFI